MKIFLISMISRFEINLFLIFGINELINFLFSCRPNKLHNLINTLHSKHSDQSQNNSIYNQINISINTLIE